MMMAKRKRSEFDVQYALCQYVAYKYPKAEYFSDLAGTHKKPTKEYLLRKGRGWSDWFLFELMDTRFNALMLELKREGTRDCPYNKKGELKNDPHLKEQMAKILKMRERGYCAGFAHGAVAAQMIVDGYMNGDLTKINKYIFPQIKPIF